VNFAVYFHEGSNSFEYVYALTGSGSFSGGGSATVGVQSAAAGTGFTQHSFNSASLSPGQMISATIAPVVCSSGNGACITTSAPATVSGRVVTTIGQGVRGARVTMLDAAGRSLYASTNNFGFFRFKKVPTGQSYVVSVTARAYSIESRLVEVNSSVSDLTLVAVRR
jgi:hypothetical protein